LLRMIFKAAISASCSGVIGVLGLEALIVTLR
jgi:hypothetical protein